MKHVLFDLKQCLITPPLDDEEYVRETLVEAAKIGKLKVLKVDTHKFQPHGVTGYALLANSHMSIHTWPEDDIVRCDLFSCNIHNTKQHRVRLTKQYSYSLLLPRRCKDDL